ncbi:putative NIF3 family GTP cyclohydrolase 1 type 2 [Desulfitispora alkaliphila]|uniref:Nif3-like dinuclear metal center hexameric protein n=1 Tax=Desulfitispora alkaliphila TaxID=622674 RepID=UPI003D215CF2
MKLGDIFDLAIEQGKESDLRDKSEIAKMLEEKQKAYDEMKGNEKDSFDKEELSNPYSDTRILYGSKDKEVKRVLAGIDIDTGEMLLADRLSERGEQIDLVIAHHPEGKALANLHSVMHLQEDILHQLGVPINVAQGIMASRIGEVERGLLPLNHNRAVDTARLLDIPLMCLHTPADNVVVDYLTKLFDEKSPETVGEVIKLLKDIPEYQEAIKIGAGPKVVTGAKNRKAGKIFVDMTGGTGGSEKAYEKLSAAGIGTIVAMHMGEKHRKEAEKNHINVIIAGHLASDSLGMNLILDKLQQRGVEVMTCSGLTRVSR